MKTWKDVFSISTLLKKWTVNESVDIGKAIGKPMEGVHGLNLINKKNENELT